MKNKKGEIAALLTLGLVIIGTLITLGTSFFVNKTKNIASNPRAASDACDDTDNSCWIVKCFDGKPGYLSYSDSLCQFDMPRSSCEDGANSPYGGGGHLAYGRASRDSMVSTFTCDGNTEQDGEEPPGPATAECPTKDYNCNKIDPRIYKDHVLSNDKDGKYHDGDSCKGTGMTKAEIKTEVCDNYKKTTSECFPWNCQSIDPNWKSQKLLAMGDGTERTYYTDLNGECNSTVYDGEAIIPICNPAAAPTCDSVSCSVATNNSTVNFGDKEVAQLSDKPGEYYKPDTDCEKKASAYLKVECPVPSASDPLSNVAPHDTLNPNDYICDNSMTEKYSSSALPGFITTCQSKYTCFKVILSDVGWFKTDDRMYCCHITCP